MSTDKSTKGNGRGYRHGLRNTPEYYIWQSMNRRCYEQSRADYPRYGGRGITVCQRWRDSVAAFYEDMGPKPSPQHSIDRIDSNGNYEPQNCRWATQEQQANNKRSSHYLTHDGLTLTIAQWARKLDISEKVLGRRLSRGWPVEKALTTPTMPPNRHNLTMLTYNGETMCIADWSRRLGIKQHTLAARLRKGWSIAEAINAPVETHPNATMITYNGETVHIAEWARRLGIKQHTLAKRLNRYGWSVEKAFTTPVS